MFKWFTKEARLKRKAIVIGKILNVYILSYQINSGKSLTESEINQKRIALFSLACDMSRATGYLLSYSAHLVGKSFANAEINING